MKSYINILFALLLFAISACSGFLEEENKSNIVADEYYTTADGFESLINANYASLRTIYGDEPYVFTLGTDLFTSGRGNPPAIGLLNYRDLTAAENNGTEFVTDFYQNLYQAIQLTNTAIYFSDQTEQTEHLDVRTGEVRFLRAYYYFLLVQTFGDVPLVTDRIDEVRLEFERTPAAEVYTFIIEEMEAALDLVDETASEPGRVDQRAVRHFLAKVHLTRGYEPYSASNDFDLAAEYADEAIGGQGLNLTFEEVFYPGNEENEEILFAIQYDPTSVLDPARDGHTQNYWYGPYFGGEGTKFGYPNRAYGLVPSYHAFDVFTEDGQYDSRWEATFMTQLYEPDPSISGATANTVGYYRYYTESDNRDQIPVKFFYAHDWVDEDAWRAENPAMRNNTEVRPFSEAWEASPNTSTDNATPAVKKFDDPSSVFSNNGSSTRDIFLARLAETYLIAAEAYLQAGDAGTAVDRINVVRRRAAKPGDEDEMEVTAVDLDLILDERARELLGEYHRWFDLKRTGTLVQRNLEHNREVRNLGSNPFGDGTLKLLRPIPQSVIDLNEALGPEDQNPGY